jgi:cytochrome b6-f complex iron-sulfur subunit
VASGYPVARFLSAPVRTSSGPTIVGKVDELPAGSAKTALVDDRPVIVVRSLDGEIRAFSALCTHLQCIVAYSPERNRIECPCHRGVYSVLGENVGGPPPRPLDELAVSIHEGNIVVGAT